MASSTSKPAPAKKLREHLQEQQEPFSLDNYLSERRYKKRLSPDGRSFSSTNDLMRSRSYELNKGRKRILYGTKILASVISKRTPTNSQELSNGNKDEDISHTIRRTQQIAETNSFFSTESLNAYLSTESNVEKLSLHSTRHHGFTHASTSMTFKFGNLKVETAADTTLHWISMEDDIILATASQMSEATSNKVCNFETKEAPSSQSSIPCKIDSGDSMVSASLWESLINSSIVKKSHIGFAKLKGITWTASSQYLRNKRLSQQGKQLLFDSVKEALETHGRKGEREKYAQDVAHPEDTKKIIYKQTGDFTNITHKMNFDLYSTLEDWSDFQQPERRIGREIGDAIMDEILKEMVDLFLQ
ncbi:hypothetical protein FH972_004701 [Carpinus fangiana]|uniref:DUF4378 domain-containing protein n=1 Tax=Carpinus fangiana TaxID=176857 RepID=A0A5N6QLY7_9ROSI|nr:hypothetical protein FH972_004701 [Carpinus fangiana]